MTEPKDHPTGGRPQGLSGGDQNGNAVVDLAGRELRAPWAAGVAGLLFTLLFTAALILLRTYPQASASDADVGQFFNSGQDNLIVIGGLYLAPFSGIAFLWFIAVIRDQLGDREDRFFATVFFGSGVLFVALLFSAAAVASSISVGVRYLGLAPPTANTVGLVRALSYTVLFAFGTRVAAVFLFSIATIGWRSQAFPRWLALAGYVLGLVLLVAVTFFDWVVEVFPLWVAISSLVILRRESARRRIPG